MTRPEVIELGDKLLNSCLDIMKAKNNDYASNEDPFANFKGSSFLGVEPEIGILLRSMDKFKRIETYVKDGKLLVEGEGVDDAIKDVINYMILLYGLILEKQ